MIMYNQKSKEPPCVLFLSVVRYTYVSIIYMQPYGQCILSYTLSCLSIIQYSTVIYVHAYFYLQLFTSLHSVAQYMCVVLVADTPHDTTLHVCAIIQLVILITNDCNHVCVCVLVCMRITPCSALYS